MRRLDRPLLGFVLLFVFVVAGSALLADDWPQWRGAARDGVIREIGVLESFPEDGLEVVWRAPVRSGFAGPAVADGRVFVLDYARDDSSKRAEGTERLMALSEETGEVLWTHEWPVSYAAIQASYATGPRATPTVDGERVFVVGAVGHLLALSVADGTVLWQHDFVAEYDSTIPIWGTSSSPLVDGELLIAITGAEPDGKVIAYDKATGNEVWRALSSNWEMGYGQPMVVEAASREQLIIWHPKAVSALAPTTGEVLWEVEWDVGMGMTVATPVHRGNHLFFTQFYYGSLLLELDQEKPAARVVWKIRGKSEMPDETRGLHSLITTPVLTDDTIYGVGSYGELRALDLETGERLWSSDKMTRQGRWGSAFMVQLGDQWLVNNDTGDLILASLTREGYREIDRTKLIEPTSSAGYGPRRWQDAQVNWSHPAYANGHIIARNDKEIVKARLGREGRP